MLIDRIKNGEVCRRVIVYMTVKCIEQFQPNKDYPGTVDRYMLPMNKDKKQAILHNYALTISEVETLLNKKED
jgi:hypothetical protein